MQGRAAWGVAVGAAGLATLASCGTTDDELVVLAAASLADVMTEMEAEFEARHPDVDVTISLAGSNSLRTQIEEGAPADVVALAAVDPMKRLHAGGYVESFSIFATNRLVLVTPIDDPGDVDSLRELADDARLVGLCAPTVPCGDLALDVLADAGVEAAPDTEEPDVRSLVAKLVAGELDAGLVYATDAAAFLDELRVVDGATTQEALNHYPIAVVDDADDRAGAERFVEFVSSEEGSRILTDAGFGQP